jgi:hypothetical protein
VDAALAAIAAPVSDIAGRVRFDANLTAPVSVLRADLGIHQLSGAAALVFEIQNANLAGLAPEGSAFGQLDLGISGGGVTVTSPGLRLGGIKLPVPILASLPIDFRRAFDDSAFLRFGEEGLAKTVVTVSQRPEGGFAAVGQLGLALSNPNLALFVEGDGAAATTANGALEHVESERLTVRVVDAQLGPATVSGNVELAGLSGAGERFSADAKVSLGARMRVGGYQIKRAEVDLAGPLDVGPGAAVLAPRAGGRIRINGFSGPLLKVLDLIRLTLTKRGSWRIVYDRLQDQLRLALKFRGFQSRGVMNAAVGGGSRINLALGAAGVRVDQDGEVLTLSGASARFPDAQMAVEGVDARISLGAESAQSGRLTISRIRHLGDEPLIRPLSLQLDVKGKGDRLAFDGALKAAGDRAQLQVKGRHNIATGIGEATLMMALVVCAPGVLQPRDFVPALYRAILETLSEVAADAKVAWGPDGLTSDNAAFRLDQLLPPRTAGPQRIRIGRLDVGVPLVRGVLDVNIISPKRVEIDIDRFDLFGGFTKSQRLVIDPTSNNFDAVLQVEGIDFARILAFAEFGELTATGRLEGRTPLHYKNCDLRLTDGLLKTSSGGGVLQYRPKEINEALKKADRSTGLAIRVLANFAYEEISVRINEVEAEEVRLDIFIKGKSLDVFDGVSFEFNIVIEGPLRQIIQESLAAPVLPPEIQDLVDRGKAIDQPAQ